MGFDTAIPSLTLPRFENSQNVKMSALNELVRGLDDFVESMGSGMSRDLT
jgi:hypothetical protein